MTTNTQMGMDGNPPAQTDGVPQATQSQAEAPSCNQVAGEGVAPEGSSLISDRSPHVEKIAPKTMSAATKLAMAEGRRRAAEVRRLKAIRKAERAAAKVGQPKGAIEAWAAKQATLGGDEKLPGINPHLTVPPEERSEGGAPLTLEQARAIEAAVSVGVWFPVATMEAVNAVLNPPKAPLAPGEIDYDRLAEAMVRAQQRSNPAQFGRAVQPPEQPSNVIAYPPVTRDDRGMLVNNDAHPIDPNRVAKGSRMERILKQLTYPADREGQVAAMVAANMAPSWGEGNQEVGDSPYPPAPEAALVAYMQEYCLALRPELPKPRLEPKYRLASEKAAGQ